jgi:hypothetical protein
VLWMGIYPSSFLVPIRASVEHVVAQVNAANKTGRQAGADTSDPRPISANVGIVVPAKAETGSSAVSEADMRLPAVAGAAVR